jgi:hypothetical protein
MPADPTPSWTTEPLMLHALDLAARLHWPAAELPRETVGPGEATWGAWSVTADRVQLAQAIGVLTVRAHRETA